jgi:trehalose 6-phosphate phosphatase
MERVLDVGEDDLCFEASVSSTGVANVQVLRSGRDLETLYRRISSYSGRPLLLLDYDGTLAPFRKERDKAVPYPGVTELLTALQNGGRTRLVLVSGRSVREVPHLLRMNPFPEIWGSHGWERQLADGTYSIEKLTSNARRGLDVAHAAARETDGLDHLEVKPVSLALHWRGVDARLSESLKTTTVQHWTSIADRYGLQMHSFDGGVELRVPGRDKGYAVRSLLAEMGPETPTAYLGDDLTDEDAFAALGTAGFAVLVRSEHRPTRADVWLRPPEDLLEFLQRWSMADGTR